VIPCTITHGIPAATAGLRALRGLKFDARPICYRLGNQPERNEKSDITTWRSP
jgi:hypothetical protein